jgi:hypothetical protein
MMFGYRIDQLNILERPGYFENKREDIEKIYNTKYKNWRELWQYGDKFFEFNQAVALYDLSYYMYIESNKILQEYLVEFKECCDNDISNIRDGLVHNTEASLRHIQDVSIRRAMVKLGLVFRGNDYLQVRGVESNGYILSPMMVPFISPSTILKDGGGIRDWVVRKDSVEAFWQANKVICSIMFT